LRRIERPLRLCELATHRFGARSRVRLLGLLALELRAFQPRTLELRSLELHALQDLPRIVG
jgi:hypothetical protein